MHIYRPVLNLPIADTQQLFHVCLFIVLSFEEARAADMLRVRMLLSIDMQLFGRSAELSSDSIKGLPVFQPANTLGDRATGGGDSRVARSPIARS